MPDFYPHYRQWSADSCAIDAIRMIGATLREGIPVERARIKGFMEDKGIYYKMGGRAGSTFDLLDRVFNAGNLAAKMFNSAGPGDIAMRLAGNSICLVEGGAHVVVVDTATYAHGAYVFQIRDPAGFDVETNVPATDPRIAGVHRVWQVSS